MDCGICISADGADYDEAIALLSESFPKARKEHRCCECSIPIAIGQKYYRQTGRYRGTIEMLRQHMTCHEIQQVYSCGEGWIYGELWDSIREQFEEFKMAGECWDQLSAASKERMVSEWRKWKGLR